MNYGEIKKVDIANGPGTRVSLFVSGCTHYCKNCFNPDTWDFNFGAPFTVQTEEEILEALQPAYIHGLTVLGGEPMEESNQRGLLSLLRRVRSEYPKKNIWCYTGYVLADLLPGGRACFDVTAELLSYITVLVDGAYVEEQHNISLRFRGSENQRLIDLKPTLRSGSVVLWGE